MSSKISPTHCSGPSDSFPKHPHTMAGSRFFDGRIDGSVQYMSSTPWGICENSGTSRFCRKTTGRGYCRCFMQTDNPASARQQRRPMQSLSLNQKANRELNAATSSFRHSINYPAEEYAEDVITHVTQDKTRPFELGTSARHVRESDQNAETSKSFAMTA